MHRAVVATSEGPESLVEVTVRRSFTTGRFFLVYGIVISVFLAVALSFSAGSSFASSFPVLLPIFGVVGSMGALVVFTNDRVKGVLEYLMAYGVSPRRIFLNTLGATLAMVSVVIVVAVGAGLGFYLVRGHALTAPLVLLLFGYGVPMAFVSAAFAATVGMFWTSLSSPRAGMNSPIGLIPFVGILPSLITLGIILVLGIEGWLSSQSLFFVAVGMVALVAAIVLVLLGIMDRFLRPERLLSPA